MFFAWIVEETVASQQNLRGELFGLVETVPYSISK